MCIFAVTPLAGVWIEIPNAKRLKIVADVTPLAGVWIEISMPTQDDTKDTVTPLAGVWIEINIKSERRYTNGSHSPCGSVD